MIGALADIVDFVRVLVTLAIVYVGLPLLARRMGDAPARPWYSDIPHAFLQACLFLEVSSLILGNWRLCYAGLLTFLMLCWLGVLAAFASRRRWIWETAEWNARVLRGLVWWESHGLRRVGRWLVMARGRARWTGASLWMAVLLGCAMLERSWFALDNYRFAGSGAYQRALSLQTLVHGDIWEQDGSVALLAALCHFSGVDGSSVIRFSGPLFAMLLTLAGGYCAWVYSRRFSAAYIACGLLSLYPAFVGIDSPGELGAPEMSCVFWVLAVAMLRQSWMYSLGAAAVALMINQQYSAILFGSLLAILLALVITSVARTIPRSLAEPARLASGVLFAVLLLRPSGIPASPDGPFQYEAAARVTADIARNFPRNRWMIVSPAQELSLTYGRGWHVELAEFVRNYTPEQLSRADFRFPYAVPDLFIFIEKEPLRQAARGAANASDEYSYQYFTQAGRATLEFQAARLMAAYRAAHANASLYYEDPRIAVYRVASSR